MPDHALEVKAPFMHFCLTTERSGAMSPPSHTRTHTDPITHLQITVPRDTE
ncbi:hypothetical protein ABG768_016222, partial [Culter alburnus]